MDVFEKELYFKDVTINTSAIKISKNNEILYNLITYFH